MVAVHGNKRMRGMFSPHHGRVKEVTEENIKKAKNNECLVEFPWLDMANDDLMLVGHQNKNIHPVTTTDEKYCLYDTFHEGNTKHEGEVLRCVETVKNL